MSRKTGEAKLTDKVEAYLDDLQKRGLPLFYEHRSGAGGFAYKKGSPDFFVVINGIHIEVELKAPDGKRSTMQDKFKWRCENEWHIPYCCPRTLEEFKQYLEQFL